MKHRASSETSKSIVGVMEGNGPMTCGEIGKPLGINHRHVRQVMQTLICRGMAHLIPNTSPRRYSLKPGAVYVETVADREELPVKRIHRPIGEWESGQLKAAAPNSVFSFGEHA